MTRARILLRDLVAHPIAGVLWALGADRAGDAVHRWWAAPAEDGPRGTIEVDDMLMRAGEFLPLLTEERDRYQAALLWRFCDAS